MKTVHLSSILLGFLFIISAQQEILAQKSKRNKGEYTEIKGIKYEVLSGLAEILSVEKVVDAAQSPLQYDEYEVLFKFHRYEGVPLQVALQETEIPFRLKYKTHEFRVGPQYIKMYQVRKGLKFAMKLMQNVDDRGKAYLYESRGLPNDIEEARANMNDLIREIYANKLRKQESIMKLETYDNTPNPRDNPSDMDRPTISPSTDSKPVEEPTDEKPQADSTSSESPTDEPPIIEKFADTVSLGDLDEERIKKELEAEILRQLKEEKRQKELLAQESMRREEQIRQKNAARDARRQKKEAERRKKAEEERKRIEAEERAAKKKREEDELREKLRAELEDKLRADMEEKEAAAERKRLEAERKKEEEETRKSELKAREEARRKAKIDEAKRASCSYKSRQSGIITIEGVKKVAEKENSLLGYEEYEVKVSFRPDSYAELEKKDKRYWDQQFTFVIDPKGKSANPSARYIRKYLASKDIENAQFQGFVQILEKGICTQVMFFAPDLPSDASQVY